MSVTIKEIAQLANVSRATVDKVINHRPGVKKETRDRIETIIEELNYQPNLLGKALVQSKEPMKIGIILTPDHNPFIQTILHGIRRAEQEYSQFGFTIIVKMLTTLEPAELVSILSELETLGVEGIAFIPLDDEQVILKANQLAKNGIAILTWNSKLEGIQDFRYVGQDHVKGGRIAAGLMEKLLPAGGNICIITSSRELSCHQDRLEGFTQRISQCKNPFKILEIRENQDKRDEAFKLTLEYCNLYPEIDGIYLTSSGCDGAVNALSLVNRLYNTRLICHDLVPETEKLLEDDSLDFVLSQSAEVQGYQLVKELFDYLMKKQRPSSHFFEIPVEIITKELV
ncbi:LacI family transcriptional regulator [Aequitasia blattaphilus]|uniref:Substrate-binding domain-containing protein n=1 Tax=Aequitasia blattaphilus TaxID=2949332 RepID=A0ABT1E7X0_9FIRM|nr:substrate-binding domain-containing protein [Aequitasia blattaphilus]MCP1100956.1 substrate-binding domain-containing protein [Aequitasia blattaphilus]MCR8613596.1 substrate-binding domain-containing protein [Aequitasia blattaphilus]